MTTNGSLAGVAVFRASTGIVPAFLVIQTSQTCYQYEPEFPISTTPGLMIGRMKYLLDNCSVLTSNTYPSYRLTSQMLPKELKDLVPRIHRLLRPVAFGMIVPETVTRTIIAMELVVLSVPLKLFLVPVYLLWRRALVIVAKDTQQRASQATGIVNGGNRLGHGQLLARSDHSATPAVDCCIETANPACY